jgi:hypothetical protein
MFKRFAWGFLQGLSLVLIFGGIIATISAITLVDWLFVGLGVLAICVGFGLNNI